jgi:hypothetical protein
MQCIGHDEKGGAHRIACCGRENWQNYTSGRQPRGNLAVISLRRAIQSQGVGDGPSFAETK